MVAVTPLWGDMMAGPLQPLGIDVTWRVPESALLAVQALDPDAIVFIEPCPAEVMLSVLTSGFGIPMARICHDSRSDTSRRIKGIADIVLTAKIGLDDLRQHIDLLLRTGRTNLEPPGTFKMGNPQPPSRRFLSLTPTQLEILNLVTQGLTNAQIARQRGTSVRAVEATLSRLFARLQGQIPLSGNARVAVTKAYLMAAS